MPEFTMATNQRRYFSSVGTVCSELADYKLRARASKTNIDAKIKNS